MSRALTPPDEDERLAALHAYGILDTPPEESFDALTRIAAYICKAPIAVINFVDRDRQWFKSEIGLGVRETPLDVSICAHAILQPGLFVVPDTTQDTRFADNPLVTGTPRLRFYAGALLESDQGHPLGTLCVLDYSPRTLSAEQGELLEALAGQVMLLLRLYRHNQKQGEMLCEIEAARRELAHLAATDALTGLANRRAFTERLGKEIARLQRNGGTSSLILADLDHFKTINDRHGHHTGDHALTVFAATCGSVFRDADLVGRWGGEEFVMLLPDTSQDDALRVAERLHTALSRTPISGDGESFHLSVSLGVVSVGGSRSLDAVLRAADEALYAAKKAGRGRSRRG